MAKTKQWGDKKKRGDCKIEYVPKALLSVIDDAMKHRVKNDIDPIGRKYQNYPRFFRAMSRDEDLKKKLKISEFKDDEDAQYSVFNIYKFIVIAFIVVIFCAGLVYVQGLLTVAVHNAGVMNEVNAGQAGYTNITLAADETFGKVNDSIQSLRLVALVMILCEGISIIITNALVKIHPLFFFPYVLIVILGIMLAAPIANAYLTILQSNIFAGTLATFTGANYLILNLPLVVLIVGILGGIGLFINFVRVTNEGGLN